MRVIAYKMLRHLRLALHRLQWQVKLRIGLKPPCRLCSGSTTVRRGYRRLFLQCGSCGFIFSDDFPERVATDGMGMVGSWGGAERGGEREDFLVRMLAEKLGCSRFLLYGVGSTLAFRVLVSEGFGVDGCDVSREVIDYRASEYGCERFFHASDLNQKRERYSAVVACEVFEHFNDPMRWTRDIVNSLEPEGILCGTTNFYPGGSIEDQQKVGYMSLPDHVAYWSESAMMCLLQPFNMKLVTFEMVCPGSVKPDPTFNDLFPNKRVFFASRSDAVISNLQQIKSQTPILPIDTSDYLHPAYRS